MHSSTLRRAWFTAGALAAIIAWDISGLDLPLSLLAGGPSGFPLREHWLLAQVLHTGARYAAWVLILLLCLASVWPVGPLRKLPAPRRVQLVASAMFATGLISLLKSASHTSCPWDLHEFGGIARHVSHWAGWMDYDGGAGRCFPAGHASTGFAFVGGWFALREDLPGLAGAWLGLALAAGLALGVAQQLRGAHFMSHTLWTGWLCWMAGWMADPLFSRRHAFIAGAAR
jgi:membrane-associated PAP2 superfamily phosphatase